MSGATVDELIAELRPLLRKHSDMPVCLLHPRHGLEGVTFVERRPSLATTEIDLYSGTLEDPMNVGRLYRELLHLVHSYQAGPFLVTIFHPAHGSEPLAEVTSDNDSLILLSTFVEIDNE